MQRPTTSQKERKERAICKPRRILPTVLNEGVTTHPSAPVKHNYCLYRDRLSKETIAKVEAHLVVCEMCRTETADTIVKADYFRRLDKVPSNC